MRFDFIRSFCAADGQAGGGFVPQGFAMPAAPKPEAKKAILTEGSSDWYLLHYLKANKGNAKDENGQPRNGTYNELRTRAPNKKNQPIPLDTFKASISRLHSKLMNGKPAQVDAEKWEAGILSILPSDYGAGGGRKAGPVVAGDDLANLLEMDDLLS